MSDENVKKTIRIWKTLEDLSGEDQSHNEEIQIWKQGFISALADFGLITEDEFDELLKLVCERIQ